MFANPYVSPRTRFFTTNMSLLLPLFFSLMYLFLIVILHLLTVASPPLPSDDHFGRLQGGKEQSWGLAPPPGYQPGRTSHNYKLSQLVPVLGRWANEEAQLLIFSGLFGSDLALEVIVVLRPKGVDIYEPSGIDWLIIALHVHAHQLSL